MTVHRNASTARGSIPLRHKYSGAADDAGVINSPCARHDPGGVSVRRVPSFRSAPDAPIALVHDRHRYGIPDDQPTRIHRRGRPRSGLSRSGWQPRGHVAREIPLRRVDAARRIPAGEATPTNRAAQAATEHLNPRGARVVALEKPTDSEKPQWYFQRYVPHLPTAGEMVLFDRSWYNHAGVEKAMGFCTPEHPGARLGMPEDGAVAHRRRMCGRVPPRYNSFRARRRHSSASRCSRANSSPKVKPFSPTVVPAASPMRRNAADATTVS